MMTAASLAQEPSLAEVLGRATDYVSELSEQLSGTVAEERYEQRSTTPVTSGFGRFGDRGRYDTSHRTLRSDYLLVRPTGSDQYHGFRDVFEVEGRLVRDREERLTRLFLTPSVSAEEQIRKIMTDSARYNVGDVTRNFNTPTFALLVLHPAYKLRFEFERVTDAAPRLGLDGPDKAADVWVIEYKETWPTTVVRGQDGKNLPAQGRFWIEPTTGRVLVSEFIIEDSAVDATITVRYETAEKLGHLVPVEMRERYDNRRAGSRVDGTATYTRFRRFQVQVEESAPSRD
jgi:hypothetical protein